MNILIVVHVFGIGYGDGLLERYFCLVMVCFCYNWHFHVFFVVCEGVSIEILSCMQ